MMKRLLPLCLLLHSFVSNAQSTINLQAAQIFLPPAAIPVDIAVIRNTTQPRPRLLVAAQGTNTVYEYYAYTAATPHVLGFSSNQYLAQQMLSIVPLRVNTATSGPVQDFAVLTADGNVTPFVFAPFNYYTPGTPVALRNGLACAATDRLVVGKYFVGGGMDLACWSNGPQPAMARAHNLGTGSFQAMPRQAVNPANVPVGLAMVTANLANVAVGLEDALMPAPAVTAGFYTFWQHSPTPSMARTWYDPRLQNALTGGPCTCIATGDVNNDGVLDVATGGTQAMVRLGYTASGQYVSSSILATYALPSPGAARDLRLADLNGDNRAELLVLSDDGIISVYENTTQSSMALYNPNPLLFFTGLDPALIRVADADSDGDLDVLIPCRGDRTVTILWNDSRALGTAGAAAGRELSAYPNPAQGKLHVRWGGTGAAAATLLDLTGRVVRQWPAVRQQEALDVADLGRGVYVLRVAGALGTATRRVVLE